MRLTISSPCRKSWADMTGGVTLNEDFIRKHPPKGETFNLFKEDQK